MIINSSQNIQSSNPLGSISSRRVTGEFRSSNTDSEDKQAIKEQQQDTSIVRQLRARDREVRAHEAAHVAAGGSLVRGGPSFTYQTGPDGRSYAIGGEVQIDASAVANDPQATLAKSNQIRAAALAPANPSAQDLRVAANANQLASRARVDIAIQRREEAQLEENQRAVDEVENAGEGNTGEGNTIAAETGADTANNTTATNTVVGIDSFSPSPESAPPVSGVAASGSANLQSSDEVAAINSFLTSTQRVSTSVLFNQFA